MTVTKFNKIDMQCNVSSPLKQTTSNNLKLNLEKKLNKKLT